LASTMSMFDRSVRKNGHSAYIVLSSNSPSAPPAVRNASTAVPNPYQPGRVRRAWPQENDQGMARRSSMRRLALREAGREPMLSSAISVIGVAAKKNSVKPESS